MLAAPYRPHPLLRLQGAAGNQAVQRLLQTKLAVGTVDDEYEREADRVAAQVTAPHPVLQRQCACGGAGAEGECAECRQEPLGIQRQAANPTQAASVPGIAPPIVHAALRSSGRPLESGTRAVMESRFGQDFSDVRIHTDGQAAESAQAVNALAYTVGRDIAFAPGQYAPGASAGQRLLAHELTHVVQQQGWGTKLQRQPPPNAAPTSEPPQSVPAEPASSAPPAPEGAQPAAPEGPKGSAEAPASAQAQVYDPRIVEAAPKLAAEAISTYRSMEKNYNNRQQQIELAIGKVQSELVAAKADETAAGKARVPRYEHTVTALKEMQEHWDKQGPIELWDDALMKRIPSAEATLALKLTGDIKTEAVLSAVRTASQQFRNAVSAHRVAQANLFKQMEKLSVWDPKHGVLPCVKESSKKTQPAHVSPALLDRLMGKYAQQGDPGEGCIDHPYVAATGEKVCTIGYGHQIPGCPILNKAGQEPTAEERKAAKVSDFTCACEGKKFDCKGAEAEAQLRKDAAVGEAHVHEVVMVDLNQDEFEALVDLTLHHGSIPAELLASINEHWCEEGGKDVVRGVYLNTEVRREGRKEIEPAFVKRREFRAWPASSEQK